MFLQLLSELPKNIINILLYSRHSNYDSHQSNKAIHFNRRYEHEVKNCLEDTF